MITYKYVLENNLDRGILAIENDVVSHISATMENKDWVKFQAWLALGNTPEAA